MKDGLNIKQEEKEEKHYKSDGQFEGSSENVFNSYEDAEGTYPECCKVAPQSLGMRKETPDYHGDQPPCYSNTKVL